MSCAARAAMYNIASALTHERLAKDVFAGKISDADELLRRAGRGSPWMGLKGEEKALDNYSAVSASSTKA